MIIQEYYSPLVIGVDTSIAVDASISAVGMFLAKTAGTLTLTRRDGTVVLNAFPVTAGQVLFINLRLHHGFTAATAGGASGTLGVGN